MCACLGSSVFARAGSGVSQRLHRVPLRRNSVQAACVRGRGMLWGERLISSQSFVCGLHPEGICAQVDTALSSEESPFSLVLTLVPFARPLTVSFSVCTLTPAPTPAPTHPPPTPHTHPTRTPHTHTPHTHKHAPMLVLYCFHCCATLPPHLRARAVYACRSVWVRRREWRGRCPAWWTQSPFETGSGSARSSSCTRTMSSRQTRSSRRWLRTTTTHSTASCPNPVRSLPCVMR
jgi:hypothetical protein